MAQAPHPPEVVLSWGADDDEATVELWLNRQLVAEVCYEDREEPVLRLTPLGRGQDIPLAWLERSLKRASSLIREDLDGSFRDKLPEVER
jgi:hypothetical protein